ncbi:MAG: formyltetrahydrofolate deformylase [Steroidobacteraceae bacterium]
MTAQKQYVLIVQCPDTKGIVAAVSGYLADNDISIVESNHFNDSVGDRFYMRTVFRQEGPRMPPLELLRDGFKPIAHRFNMSWQLYDSSVRPKVLIAVSKAGHCLYDLLHRWRAGQLAVEIPAVVSNHDDMRSFVEWSGIPYYHLPVAPPTSQQQQAQFLQLVHEHAVDLVVLARYMQILSPALCQALAGRCINIHHSFLPSFKGARPHAQAHERGVKLIGATAHYVTSELDEGPIIEQGVARVSHAHTPAAIEQIGRDIECTVLARAVRWHVERRVVLNDRKTVVFA